ncbi:dienelactone hydrolase family protein [Larkinella terrae]|uniref:Prolyl oligopeptidase family serine peptidase n=1 Tax=Larkinella terrae TaxID=2025311 RepID=A0A7K0ER13_9BACT|nr:alpha/beta fold hydrolase [Larkinella terrae]MRS64253.1 prolyl oligopeptidase family serine peptidase [Larkinella terrae]
MKPLLFVLLLGLTAGFAQKKTVPRIDASVVKVDSLLWDLNALSKAPAVEWLSQTGTVRPLLYKGVDYEGKPTQVFAYYSNPDLIRGKPASKRTFPGVVLIHGGGGKAFREWVEKWAADGYAAIAMDLAGKDATGKPLAQAGPNQGDVDKFSKLEKADLRDMWTYQAVSAAILAHSLLLSFPEVDATKTAVTGISWGGYLTCLVASLDNRFKAAAPVYGCAFYDESDIFKVPIEKLSAGSHRRWMKYFDPSVYLPFAKPQFLFVNGNKDRFYNVVPYHKTYSLIAPNQRTICLIPNMAHGHEAGWVPHEIRYFFESILNGNVPLVQVGPITVQDSTLRFSYQSPVSLLNAEFHYSADTTSLNEQRNWSKQKAMIDPITQTATSPMPKEGFKYGFFYLKDHRNVSVSSPFLIK